MSITPQHFKDYDWKSALENSERPLRTDYLQQFTQRVDQARDAGNRAAEDLYSFLKEIVFPYFELGSKGPPFPGIEEIDEDSLQALAEVFHEVNDPELRARIGDILWLRRIGDQSYQFASEAFEAYLDSASRLQGVNNNKPTIERFARASSLAVNLQHDDKQTAVASELERRIRNRAPEEETWWSRDYSELLYDNDWGTPHEQGQLMEQAAESIEDPENGEEGIDYWTSRKYWRLASLWYNCANDTDAKFRTRREAAECFVRLADLHEDEALMEASYLEDACAAYQNVRNAQDRKEELLRRMLVAQERSVSELSPVSTEIGNEKLRKDARDSLKGLELRDALVEFALIHFPLPRQELERVTRAGAQRAPAQAMIGGKQINAFGRVTGRKPSFDEDEKAAFEYEVYKTTRLDWAYQVANTIEPSRHRLIDEHDVDTKEIVEFLSDNPIVAPTRVESFAKGLQAGFQGNFLVAMHVLAVQFENSVRYLLQREGAITSGFAQEDKTQYERNLNNFLDPEHDQYSSYIDDLFGEDMAFQLRALLVDDRGANLRNEVAHGLLPDRAYGNPPAIYLWWLVWHLIVYRSPYLAEWIGDPMDIGE